MLLFDTAIELLDTTLLLDATTAEEIAAEEVGDELLITLLLDTATELLETTLLLDATTAEEIAAEDAGDELLTTLLLDTAAELLEVAAELAGSAELFASELPATLELEIFSQ